MTTDIWTSHHNTGLTVHYVDDSYNLQNHLLEVVEFPESHTGVKIFERIGKYLEDIQDNLSAMTALTLCLQWNFYNGAEYHALVTHCSWQLKLYLSYLKCLVH